MPNAFKNATARNIGVTETSVYTAPAASQVTVIGMTIANITTSNITVTVRLSEGGNFTHIVKDALIRPGSSIVVVGGDQKIVLEATDSIRVTSSLATSIDVVMSVLEIT